MIKIGVESPIQLALVSQEVVELEIQVQPPLELMLAHNDVTKGDKGDSAYIIAVKNGFVGTEQQWEESLNGTDGIDGIDGREVELQTTSTYIQWRYVGDTLWTNLIALSSLEGQDGKSAYQSYLDATSDVPPLSESEWANLCSTKVSEAPIDGTDYVRQNGTWAPLPERIGAGFESNVYLSNTDSSTAGYKKLLYDADTSETIKTIVANNNTVQGEKYLYDFAIETTTINPGIYKFAFYGNISNITGGTSTLSARVFLYNTSGGETTLFTATKILTNTVNGLIDFTYNVTSVISCNYTDRLGIQISLTTTRNTNTTLTYYLGDGHPSYFVTTLPYRHKSLRDLSWLQSGHTGTASKLAGFNSFGNAAEIDKLPATAITINPTVLNNLSVLDVILSQLVDKFDLGQFKKTTYQTEFDNGNSSSAKTIDWNNGQNQKIILTANCVLTLPSVTGTGRFQIKFIQDMFAGWSVTFSGQTVKNPSSFDFANGQHYQECIATFYWDGGKYIMLSTPYYS